jgi:quinol monooxygenase YgiN
MIHVIAVLTAKPGKRDEVLKEFRANVPNVRAEKGCIEYGAAVDLEPGPKFQTRYGADAVVVVEKWEDAAALEAHARAPHMAAYAAKVKDLLADRKVHILMPT